MLPDESVIAGAIIIPVVARRLSRPRRPAPSTVLPDGGN
jgi:hypothetical protein